MRAGFTPATLVRFSKGPSTHGEIDRGSCRPMKPVCRTRIRLCLISISRNSRCRPWSAPSSPSPRRKSASPSPAIAQAGGYAVDGELDPGQHLLARRARAIELHELDLHVVERIEIGKAVADRPVEQRIALEQLRLLHDRVEGLDRIAPFARNAGEDSFAHGHILDQAR